MPWVLSCARVAGWSVAFVSGASSVPLPCLLQAMLEQTDLRISSLKREAYEFKRDVVIGGQHPRNGKTMGEKVSKYYEDGLRAKDALADKLRLKNQTLRGQQLKLDASLKQKEEAGDVLHYIDFHQLQIENKQYLSRIEERNNELLRLKLSTGATIQSLNGMKAKLSESARQIVRLRGETKTRSALLQRLRVENGGLAEAVARSQEMAEAMARAARASSDLPTVLDYMELSALQGGLQKELASWQRKLEIAELTAHQATLKAQQAGLPVPPLAATVPPLPAAMDTTAGGRAGSSAGPSGRGSAAGRSDDAAGVTRRSGRLLDVDIFAAAATGGSTMSPAAAMLATPARGGGRSAATSAASTSSLPSSAASRATRTPGLGPAHSPMVGALGRPAHSAVPAAAASGFRAHSAAASGPGRPLGGRETARLPGVATQAHVPGVAAALPKSVGGFGGAGRGTLRLGLSGSLGNKPAGASAGPGGR